MKTLKALAQQLEHLLYRGSSTSQPASPQSGISPQKQQASPHGPGSGTPLSKNHLSNNSEGHPVPANPGEGHRRRAQSATLFIVAVVGLTGVTGQRFYDQPTFNVGTIAPKTLYAPRDATVLDERLTEERRQQAINAENPVLRVDATRNLAQYNELDRILSHGDELRQKLGPFPTLDKGIVSTDVQRHLRQISSNEWISLRRIVQAQLQPRPVAAPLDLQPALGISSSLNTKALQQLRAIGDRAGIAELELLLRRIDEMRYHHGQAKRLLADPDLTKLNAAYSVELFELSRPEWDEVKPAAKLALTRILAQGIPLGLSPESIQQTITLHTRLVLENPASQAVATQLLQQVLEPNLVQDEAETKRQAERAAQLIEPAMASIRKGEAIVEANEEITPNQLVLLDEFGLSERGPNWISWLGFGGIIGIEILIFKLIQGRFGPRLRRRDWIVVGILAASTPLLVIVPIQPTSLPAVGLLIGSFYGSTLGVAAVVLLAVALPIGLTIKTQILLASAAAGIVGALIAGRLRSREELALLGLGVGFTQGLVHLIVSLILTGTTGTVWLIFLRSAFFAALRGIAWSIVALGVSPYLERLFDLITPIRMAELSNPNRPLLQRLAAETPGTFQHTLFVSTLAEAAARSLGCNVELVRAGTLYHDIGKMHDPQGFIENQMGATNKHDLLNDPWKSAAIIKKHVTEGEIMARRCRLPRALRSFIPEHQGTMRISYFYQQAQKLAAEHPDLYQINEADFRYDAHSSI
ncbi:MAG: HDIG domain-containing protein [Synechococcales cyanobacterium RM1_1_8]|nr:HDIG domain-containing protein [Synechococcales cyanobacterium RM1_1_8]